MRKIDIELEKIVALSQNNSFHTCLIYVNNFLKAKQFFNNNGIKILNEYKFLNLIAVKSTQTNILGFLKLPFVEYVSRDAKVMTLVNVAKKIMGADKVDLNEKATTVAVIDTGIKSHLDFVLGRNRIKEFVDFVNEKTKNYDDNGHGTFVTGVLAGSGLKSFGKYKGFTPKSDIVSLKALDKNGEANAMIILNAMEWVYNNHKKYNIKVVCMSFGSEPCGNNDPIKKGAEKLWNAGIVVVAAAGNSGPKLETIKSPGISSKIITVGGFNDNRIEDSYNENFFEVAEFSSRGPAYSRIKPDVVAPGVDITSCGIEKDYIALSGTSVATPMIAGICALILQKYPNLKPDQVKKMLLLSCKPICYDYILEGRGYPIIT